MNKAFMHYWKEAPRGIRISAFGFFFGMLSTFAGFVSLSIDFKLLAVIAYFLVIGCVLCVICGVLIGWYDKTK